MTTFPILIAEKIWMKTFISSYICICIHHHLSFIQTLLRVTRNWHYRVCVDPNRHYCVWRCLAITMHNTDWKVKHIYIFYCPSVILYNIVVSGNVIQNGRQDIMRPIDAYNQQHTNPPVAWCNVLSNGPMNNNTHYRSFCLPPKIEIWHFLCVERAQVNLKNQNVFFRIEWSCLYIWWGFTQSKIPSS